MVRAILDGRKTQTRRIVKPQPKAEIAWYPTPALWAEFYSVDVRLLGETDNIGHYWKCPYGVPGDRLWVRETWQALSFSYDHYSEQVDDWGELDLKLAQREIELIKDRGYRMPHCGLVYRADDYWKYEEDNPVDRGFRWRPSIHMPRWASRLTLEVTGVRVERVQDVNEEDIQAEGLAPHSYAGGVKLWSNPDNQFCSAQDAFSNLWDSLNAKRGYGWDKNPWTWVIEFRRLDDAG